MGKTNSATAVVFAAALLGGTKMVHADESGTSASAPTLAPAFAPVVTPVVTPVLSPTLAPSTVTDTEPGGGFSSFGADEPATEGKLPSLPSVSYLWDGGALPFVWGALGARLAIDHYLKPPSTPVGFSATDGGAAQAPWEVPGWAVTATGGALALGLIARGDDSKWYHVKGIAETLSTGVMVTGLLKDTFGRHRPDYDAEAIENGTYKYGGPTSSFPSGHTTQAFQVATYGVLYLRYHGFDKLRPHGEWRWWEGAAYAGIYTGAALVGAERVYHDRHHVTDALAGAAIGTASSALFFWYQEHRYRKEKAKQRDRIIVSPSLGGESGMGVNVGWTW